MLEILFLIWFCKKLAAIARDKNRSGSWGALGALGWLGGEVGGFVFAFRTGFEGMGAYGYAIIGAIIGAVIAHVIVQALPKIPFDKDFPTARVV